MAAFIDNFVEFIAVLRHTGLTVGTSEAMDALLALTEVDISDKVQVKTAMGACLAKTPPEQEIFRITFEKYFIPPVQRQKHFDEWKERQVEHKQQVNKAIEELKFQEKTITLPAELNEVYAALPPEDKDKIREFLEKTSSGKNVKPDFLPMVESMVSGRLLRTKKDLPRTGFPQPGAGAAELTEAGMISSEVKAEFQKQEELLYKNISDITEQDVPRAIVLINRLVDGLKKELSRRYRADAKRVRLHFKKTVRYSLNTGGILIKLKYLSHRQKRLKLLLLCDVSASMYRFSGFVLQFTVRLIKNYTSMDAYAFSEEILHITPERLKNASEFEDFIKTQKVWRKGTNVGHAMEHILNNPFSGLTSSSILIIVSDAMSLEADKLVDKLRLLSKKLKKVIWLNPLAESSWSRIPRIDDINRLCSMFDCSNLQRLSEAVRKISL